jgi:hypothetical protein
LEAAMTTWRDRWRRADVLRHTSHERERGYGR